MRNYQNPFRVRASEQERDPLSFLRNFGVGVLELLPESVWDRPFILRSAPGAGKTSLMRLFCADSLAAVATRIEDLGELAERLTRLGALDEGRPARLGVLLSLSRDYRALADVGGPKDFGVRLFFHLLDARVMVAVMRGVLTIHGGRFPDDCARVAFRIRHEQPGTFEAADRIGGTEGSRVLEASRRVEGAILDALDALDPDEIDTDRLGHGDLYSLRLLSDADIYFGSERVTSTPLVLLDDGHELAEPQREGLVRRLRSRELRVARWYSERFEALSPQESLLAGDIPGRDYELLELEAAARAGEGRRFEKVLLDIADRRASHPLQRYTGTDYRFSDLCRTERESPLGDIAHQVISTLRERLDELIGQNPRYESLLVEGDFGDGYEHALRLRELIILIERDRRRPAQELFDLPISGTQVGRLLSSSVREAARLFLAREFDLPYYAGPEILARLGSQNIEQFLSLCGEVFEEMLASITLGRRPGVSPARQDLIVRRASKLLVRSIPQRLPYGPDVQRLVAAIGSMAERETFRPTAPYSPGVTGTALTMSDRAVLLDADRRGRLPGAERLLNALGSAVAFNVLSAELDRSVKGGQYMVLNLNRLLCPQFGLPLQRGGFRERKLLDLIEWLDDPSPANTLQGGEVDQLTL